MTLTIQNGLLSLTVDTLGAQMRSLKYKGTEYLWQGDPPFPQSVRRGCHHPDVMTPIL